MDALIDTIRYSSVQIQALAVTVGGLIGVFATLGVFYILITIANKFGGGQAAEGGAESDAAD
jgi:hypothetical protein